MFRRLFLDHPASVEESYGEHFRVASGVGMTMLLGALACFAHALVPALFKSTGSATIGRLHARIVKSRGEKQEEVVGRQSGSWVI